MESYDLFMLLVLGAVTLFGLMKGFVWQIAWVASFVVSAIAALHFGPEIAVKYPNSPLGTPIVAGMVVFIATSCVIWMIFRFVSGWIDRMKLNSFDHQMGAVLGLVRGALWCIGITYFALGLPMLSDAQRENIIASRSGQYIVVLLDEAKPVLPAEIHQQLQPVITRVRQRFDPNYQPDFQLPDIPVDDLRSYFPAQDSQAGPPQPAAPQQPAYDPNYQPREFSPPPYSASQPVPNPRQ